jgi:hypothetical protein
MKEYQSSDRLFAGTIILLPAMTSDELKEIMHITEESIDHYMTFTPEAADRVATLAKGHPYMVHLIGKYAIRVAYTLG